MKLATVDVENGDNMATLPAAAKGGHATCSAGGGGDASSSDMNTIEKNNATNKEMELKNVMAKPLQRSIYISFKLETGDSKGFSSLMCIVKSGSGQWEEETNSICSF